MTSDPSLGAWLRRLPHYLYLVDLLPGRRVLEVGCGVGYGAQFLANHGAGRVIGIDRSARLVAEARARCRQTNLDFRREDPSAIELEDDSVDVLFVPDGDGVLRRRSVLGELRRVLRPGGYLVLCAQSADRRGSAGGASFYELGDRLEALFSPVRIVAQTPFVGFSLVEYGGEAEAPPIQLDTSLMELSGGEAEPCDYVALCGGDEASLRGYSVVELPDREGLGAVAEAVGTAGASVALAAPAPAALPAAPPPLPAPPEEPDAGTGVVVRELRQRLETAVEDRGRAEAQAEELRAELEELRAEFARERAGAGQDRGAAVVVPPPPAPESAEPGAGPSATEQIAAALAAHREAVVSLEVALEEGQAYAEELEAEAEEVVGRAEAAERARRHAEERAEQLSHELRGWRSRASTAEGRLLLLQQNGASAALEQRVAQALAERDDLARQVRRLEAERTAAATAAAAATVAAAATAAAHSAAAPKAAATLAAAPATDRHLAAELSRLQAELSAERDLLSQIERGLVELEQEAARDAAEQAPSAWAAHRDQQLRELSAELGVKDAEITILHVGVSALRARLQELVGEVRRVVSATRGRPPAEMSSLLSALGDRLAAFEERD